MDWLGFTLVMAAIVVSVYVVFWIGYQTGRRATTRPMTTREVDIQCKAYRSGYNDALRDLPTRAYRQWIDTQPVTSAGCSCRAPT